MEQKKSSENLLPFSGEMFLYENFFSPLESAHFYKTLLEETPWKLEPIKLFGKLIMQPRMTAWYGDEKKDYTYSGVTMKPLEWSEALHAIKANIETISGAQFNSVLLNRYRDGNDSVGWHRDNEKGMGSHPTIASVSFGSARNFKIRVYKEKTYPMTLILKSGSLLLMKGEMQNVWEHHLPKMKGVSDERINLTFRFIQ